MPTWNQLREELQKSGSTHDVVRRKYLRRLSNITGRNTIFYYSGWLQKSYILRDNPQALAINDSDKNGFMAAVHQLDRSKGLDLILHTLGGSSSATESLVDYLRSMFDGNVRAIVPQIAMSAGTLICCACTSIIMGKQSSLGPIDPQFNGVPAHGVKQEFEDALKAIKKDPASIPLWQAIVAKYNPTLIGECEKAIEWSNEMAKNWLETGMLASDQDRDVKISTILKELGDHALTKAHDRHISINKAREMGLVVEAMEDNPRLQDAILSVHHATILTLTETSAVKVIENQKGVAFIQTVSPVTLAMPGAAIGGSIIRGGEGFRKGTPTESEPLQ